MNAAEAKRGAGDTQEGEWRNVPAPNMGCWVTDRKAYRTKRLDFNAFMGGSNEPDVD